MKSDNGVLRGVVASQLLSLEETFENHNRESFRAFVLLNPRL